MTSAVPAVPAADHTELKHVLRASAKLGVLQSICVGLFALLQPKLEGPMELLICGAILVVGVAATIALPGIWTKAKTIEGIAGASGIGLAATVVFLAIDVVVFQPMGLYTNRWRAIGGGSNWWYHPVWWMVGTYLPMMGAWVLANQANRRGNSSPAMLVIGTLVLSAIIMVVAKAVGFPGAQLGLGTFGVSVLPATAVLVALTGIGARSG